MSGSNQSASFVNALLSGYTWHQSVATPLNLTYSFPFSSSGTAYFGSSYGDETRYEMFGFDAEQRAYARQALQQWQNVANLEFTEVADGQNSFGDIRFTFSLGAVDGNTWGYAYLPGDGAGGDIWIDGNQTIDFTPGNYDFLALVHEIGHGLGLDHPFEGSVQLPAAEDSYQYTVMSYSTVPNSQYVELTGANRYTIKPVLPDGPMLYDIAAIQHLYGANRNYKTGNDLYAFDPSVPFYKTIWDAGGDDTLSAQDYTLDVRLDLREGAFSDFRHDSPTVHGLSQETLDSLYDGRNNLAISFGTVIENAIGGSGNDRIDGNSSDNHIQGMAGNDRISGHGGNDRLDGGAGRDVVEIDHVSGDVVVSRSAADWMAESVGSSATLVSIERVEFQDVGLALDLDGEAGIVVRLISAVFGKEFIRNADFVDIGLDLLAQGISYLQLAEYAASAAGLDNSPEQLVTQLYTNVVGVGPQQSEVIQYQNMLNDDYGVAELTLFAAETDLNALTADLVGLSSTGVEYSLSV